MSEAFDHDAFDPWKHKPIRRQNFAGKVIGRQTADEMWGTRDLKAHIVLRLERITAMAQYARSIPNGPGIWVDNVMRQIRMAARDLSMADVARFPSQRAALQRKYGELVDDTEIQLENVIRLSLGEEPLRFENASAALNFRVGSGAGASAPSRREVEKAETFSPEGFIVRLRVAGIWIEQDPASGGLTYHGGSALGAADKEALMLHREALELYATAHPELVGPPPPPPVADVEAMAAPSPPLPPTPAELQRVATLENVASPAAPPTVPPGGVAIQITTVEGKVLTGAEAAERDRPKKRRAHAFSTGRLPSR